MIVGESAISFSSTISLGVILLAVISVLCAGWSTYRTQSIKALRDANTDLRADRDDWEARFRSEEQDKDRLEQRLEDMRKTCQALEVEVARLQGMTDTSRLATGDALRAFQEEMHQANERKLDIIQRQSEMIALLVSRDPALRTRNDDQGDA